MAESYRFLKACRREEVDCTPVWLMRQAGRYMKEYQALREKCSFLEMCKTPEIAAEVTLQPVNKLDVDAAILFSDILITIEAMGINLEFSEGKGPVILNPARTNREIEALDANDIEEKVPFVVEAIKILKKELEGKVPLIGFSGAPFTLASYIVEGGHSRNYLLIKQMMYNEPSLYSALLDKVTQAVISYLKAQIAAGVQAVQLFDSWVGILSPRDYEQFVLPFNKRVFDGLGSEVPTISFATDTAGILELLREAGGDVIGVDWRINLDEAWQRLGYDVGIQGNLDPTLLFTSPQRIEQEVKNILEQAANRPGHIFNLGHGILPKTPVENVEAMIEAVHKYSQRHKEVASSQ